MAQDWPERVAEMKQQDGGDILVSGSADLVNGLMERGLIDEYQIFVFPVVLGSGKHLFRDGIDVYPMRLMKTQTFDTGVVLLVYEPRERSRRAYCRLPSTSGPMSRSARSMQPRT